ncbi:MAG: DUF3298 domain-containing protein [Flavobacteriales bacterium]|nr:DUF3298 domain-containing protein [Crocinitomicaceae bacterium]NBX79476.1 DUF3298 domain-containing protein [Flavobacteriales bacterium]NCA20425.1 DUF3298 domain-containing protein [Crocinitomicaceae bacterium]
MRNKSWLIAIVVFAFYACSNGAKKSNKSDKAKPEETHEEEYIPKIKTGVASVTLGVGENEEDSKICYSYYELTDKSLLYEENVNKLLGESITIEQEEPEEKAKETKLSHKHFLSILKDFKRDFDKYSDTDYPWTYFDSCSIDESYKAFVQVFNGSYSYTGGAHGNSYEGYYLFSKETGEQLRVKDLVTDTKKLNKIADKYFRQSNQLSATDNLEEAGFWFTKGFELNDNFYFEKGKLIFIYNQYEIGPYAMGIIYVEIPISEIKSILKVDLDRTK